MNGASPHLEAGASLGSGRYVIDGVLGQGGFGITYRATDTQLDRPVAIKEFFLAGSMRVDGRVVPPAGMAEDFADRRRRVVDEARALARFRHPGIVTVHEYVEENDTVYVVMELLSGRTLRSVLAGAGGPLPEPEAVGHAAAIAAALDAVHAEQLLHRDVKPDNVMVLADGQVVLVDFGTAREFALGRSSMMSQTLTPGYAPVEQYTAHGRFGPPTDVYALGATTYHMLTGQPPVPSLDRYRGTAMPAPRELNPAISVAASDAVLWAMQVEAEHRPQTAGEFAAALAGSAVPSGGTTRIVTPDGGLHRTVTGVAGGHAGRAVAQQGGGSTPVRRSRARRAVRRGARRVFRLALNLVITIIIGVLATVAVMWFLERDEEPTPQPLPVPTVAVAEWPAAVWQAAAWPGAPS